ncbi:Bug family tripartite tricarboxylate transporter substrate binding protein [Ramlibacter sp. MAHUQ-53]|uniref:Bug family tripartite tricarboxylate transporter substrate binding protein n=1 Tax=unclassified Ramlibacter TaxID=2617605 RepID=UPI003640BEC1
MRRSPRRGLLAALAAVAALPFALSAQAQANDYPNKPIRLIAPFPTGTGPDANTREIAQELTKVLGQSVVVENRPGASSMIGMEAAAKSAPDGYTLVIGPTSAMSVVPHLYAKVPYNAEKDFAPVSIVGMLNTAMIANASLPQATAREVIARLKSQPGSIVAATSGVGSYSHLAGEWFAAGAGTKITFVPYNTSSPYADLVAGQVQLMFDALPAAIGNVKAGKLKVLAMTGATRHPNFPDVPTFAEAGLPASYSPTAWIGLFAPAGTPKPIVDKLAAAMQKATTQNPALQEKWRSYGGEMKAMTPEAFAAFLKQDSNLWGQAIRGAGIKLD